METLGIPNIEVGFAQCSGNKAFQTGVDVANLALENIKWHQVSVAFVSASTSFDLGDLLKGIGSIIDEAPLIGVASNDESIKGEVTLTVIASSFLQVHVSTGTAVSTSWKKAVRQATKKKSIRSYFTLGSDIMQQLMSLGKHAFGLLLTHSGTGQAKPYSVDILETLTHRSDGRLPFVGGAVTGDLGANSDYILFNEAVLKDSILIAIFETNLQTGIGMAHGFTPSKRKFTITKAIATEILEINNQPAAEVYANLMSCSLKELEDKHLDMTTGTTFGISDLHGHQSIVVAVRTTKRRGIIISESLPSGTILFLMESDKQNLLQAKQEAFRKAVLRGNITQPEFCFSFSNIFRNKLLTQYSDLDTFELHPGMPILEIQTHGEYGISIDGRTRYNQKSIALIVMGAELTDAAKVAMENKRLVHELVLAEASQKTLLNLMPDAVMATNNALEITHWNPAAEKLTGRQLEQVIGRGIDKVLHPKISWQLRNTAQSIKESDTTDISYTFSAELVRTDDIQIPVEVTVAHNPHQEQYALVCVFHDMTTTRRSEDRLRRERKAYRSIAEAAINAPSIVELCEQTLAGLLSTLQFDFGTMRLFNKAQGSLVLSASVGVKENELPYEIKVEPYEQSSNLEAETAYSLQALFASTLSEETQLIRNKEQLKALGVESLILYPILNSGGNLLGVLNLASYLPKRTSEGSKIFFEVIVNMFATVLERRFAQEALIDSEEEIRLILQSMRDIVIVLDENDNFTDFYCSDNQLQIENRINIIGKHISDQFPAAVAHRFSRTAKQVRATGNPETFDYSLDIKGKKIWFSGNFSKHEDGRSVTIVARDITQRKLTENLLAKRLEYEKTLAITSQSLLISQEDPIKVLRDVLLILLNTSDTSRIYIFQNYEDQKGLAIRLLAARTAEGLKNLEEILAKEVIVYSEGFERWKKDLSQGKPIVGLTESFPVSERPLLHFLEVASILVLPLWVQGKWFGFIAFDEIEKKRIWTNEEVRLLQTASEMISGYIGRMNAEMDLRTSFRDLELYSSILRHDLANDIMIILNQIETAELLGLDDSKLRDIKDTSKASAERMSQVLSIFKAAEGEAEQYIVPILENIIEEAQSTYPSVTITLNFSLKVRNQRVSIGRMLPMVFFNLIRNSSEYSGETATVTIDVKKVAGGVQINYYDDGPGIEKSIRERLFQKGVSTTGGGLGLYLSKRVIESYGGTIELIGKRKSPKRGATFRILLLHP